MPVTAAVVATPPARTRRLEVAAPIDWHEFDATRVDPATVGIVRATFLLEARSAMYGDYLRRVLPPRFSDRVDAWAVEESHHARALRRWLALADPTFDAEAALDRFAEIPYHADASSDRGGATQELMARCVVEALACGYYLALADRVEEPLLRSLTTRLASDERRHFHQFLAWSDDTEPLSPTRRFVAIVRRLVELEDDQISGAASISRGADARHAAAARRRHFAAVYSMYRRQHVGQVQDMVWAAVGRRPPATVRRLATTIATTALRARAATLLFGWSLPVRPTVSIGAGAAAGVARPLGPRATAPSP